jgi:FkbM family methyltransferase
MVDVFGDRQVLIRVYVAVGGLGGAGAGAGISVDEKNMIKNHLNQALKKGLEEVDRVFTLLLDRVGVSSLARVPYDKNAGVCGPVNLGREALLDAVERLLRGKKMSGIVDCGAFQGHVSRTYSLRFPEATIYAFEPVPETFRELQERSSPFPLIKPINKALGKDSGKRTFYETVNPGCSSLSLATDEVIRYQEKDYAPKKEYEVEVVTLDEWWKGEKQPTIQFIKMDVQGGELEVLKGATRVLGKAGVCLIQAEVVFFRQYAGGCLFSELEGFLRKRGFSFYQFYELWTAADGRLAGCDALFLSPELKEVKLIG